MTDYCGLCKNTRNVTYYLIYRGSNKVFSLRCDDDCRPLPIRVCLLCFIIEFSKDVESLWEQKRSYIGQGLLLSNYLIFLQTYPDLPSKESVQNELTQVFGAFPSFAQDEKRFLDSLSEYLKDEETEEAAATEASWDEETAGGKDEASLEASLKVTEDCDDAATEASWDEETAGAWNEETAGGRDEASLEASLEIHL